MREVGTQTAAEEDAEAYADEQPAAARHPLEGWRWLRLAILTASCAICAGVLVGSAQWVPIMADAGVGGSRCPDGSASTCDKQVIFIAGAFSAGQCVCMFTVVLVGYLFDRFGASFSGTLGALIVCMGLLILQIPLVGAQYGYDAQTSGFLVWGLIVIDVGTALNNYCLFGLLYHFPDYQTLVIGLTMVASGAPALCPMLTIAVQDRTGLPLHLLFFGWLGLAVLACIACRLVAPTLEEYDDQVQKVLGYPPPRAGKASFFSLLKDANSVLRCNWIRHLFFGLCLGLISNSYMTFATLSSAYGSQLFHSKKAGEELSQLYTISLGLGGVFFTPAVSYLSDKLRHALRFPVATTALLLTACAFCIGKPTWSAAEMTGASSATVGTLLGVLVTKYIFAFATASRVGFVLGLFILYESIPTMICMTGTFTWISSSPEDLTTPLQVAAWIAAGSFLAWGAYLLYAGLPAVAVVLPKDEEHLATAFGCRNFEELVRKTGLQGRDEVIKMLSDPQSLQSLVRRANEEEEARRRAAAGAAGRGARAERERVPATWAPPQATSREASWTFGFGFAFPCCVTRAKPEDDGYFDGYLEPLLDAGTQQKIFAAARPRESP